MKAHDVLKPNLKKLLSVFEPFELYGPQNFFKFT